MTAPNLRTKLTRDELPETKENTMQMTSKNTVMEILGNDTENVLKILESATPEQIKSGIDWYPLANRIATDAAEKENKPVNNLIWMLAALSPNTDWKKNLAAFHQMLETGDTRHQTGVNKDKAKDILGGQLNRLGGDKVNAFARAIENPTGSTEAVIDRHALSIHVGRPLGKNDLEAATLANRSKSKNPELNAYKIVADVYARVAEMTDFSVHEVQAITWVVWRDMHDVERKIGSNRVLD